MAPYPAFSVETGTHECFPGLAWNHDPPDLCLLSSWIMGLSHWCLVVSYKLFQNKVKKLNSVLQVLCQFKSEETKTQNDK
jgi:hypothetical protein